MLVRKQLEGRGIDILSTTIALQNLCIAHITKDGGGEGDIRRYLSAVYGERRSSSAAAKRFFAYARESGITG